MGHGPCIENDLFVHSCYLLTECLYPKTRKIDEFSLHDFGEMGHGRLRLLWFNHGSKVASDV